MQVDLAKCLALCLSALAVVQPADANRMTFEVWPDASPDHVVACTFALADGWISLVQAKGLGKPVPTPMRWRASKAEVDALSAACRPRSAANSVRSMPMARASPLHPSCR